jgi:LysM repeat protein
MDSDDELEQEDFIDEEEEIIEEPIQNRRDTKRRSQKPSGDSFFRLRNIFFIIALVAVLLIIVIARSGKSKSDEQLVVVTAEIANVKKSILDLESRVNRLQDAGSESEKSDSSFLQHLDAIDNRLTQIENKNTDLEAKAQSSAKKVEKVTVPKAKKSSYEVKRGDTLYSVAKKHGISVEKLQRLNALGKNQSISPGQKLLIE